LPSYRRHRFPPEIIQHAIWLSLRFTLSYRDVEDLLAERGVEIAYETVRRWVMKFGPVITRRRPQPSDRWHLDEMVVRITGKRMYLWRAVDDEGEVPNMLVRRGRDSRVALRLMCKLLKKQGYAPKLLVTDKLRPYASAYQVVRQRERKLQRSKSARSAQCFFWHASRRPQYLQLSTPSRLAIDTADLSSRGRQRDGQMPSPQRETRPALTPFHSHACYRDKAAAGAVGRRAARVSIKWRRHWV